MFLNPRVFIIAAALLVIACGIVYTDSPASAQTQVQAGQVIISELRYRGPNGSKDEYVEIYNNTDSPIVVAATDPSAGWSLIVSSPGLNVPFCLIPNGTTIPARGHYLCANTDPTTGYSLSGYPAGNPTPVTTPAAITAAPIDAVALPFGTATPDRAFSAINDLPDGLPDGAGIALFTTQAPANANDARRLDSFGFANSPALYKEGAGFPTVVTSGLEHAYYRDLRGGLPKDTGDNAADFLLVGTTTNLQITRLGAPGPENRSSPIVNNATITPTLLDPSVSSASPPNRERTFTAESNATFGTLLIRRTITNNTGLPITRLRFRAIIITTVGTPSTECGGGTCADLRVLTSQGGTATVGGQQVIVLGLRLEEPPTQLAGGGYNSSLSVDTVTVATQLQNTQSINVEFRLGVERTGPFRFFLNIEALNGSAPVILGPVADGVDAGGNTTNPGKKKLIADTVEGAPAAAPESPAAPTSAAPSAAYAPLFINLTPARAAEDEKEKEEKEKEEEGEAQKSEGAPPSAAPAPQAPEASAPASPADAADDSAPQPPPATTRRAPAKKLPPAAKPRPRENQ
jgi:hypothetical protein